MPQWLSLAALDIPPGWWAIGAAVALAVLGVAWFALRFWLASTRPANIQEVHTPRLNRLNQNALERMARGDDDDDEDDEAPPEALKAAAPPEPAKHE